MEKLGVQTEQDKTKTASEKKTCPSCGTELVSNTNVPKCPSCGTKPFETDRQSSMTENFNNLYGKK